MSVLRVLILPDTYRDSVFLMKLASQAGKESGAIQISAMMGSARNKELFRDSGMSTPEVEAAKADDLVIAVLADDSLVDAVLRSVQSALEAAPPAQAGCPGGVAMPQDIAEALERDKALNLAMISVAGDYARYEAAQALAAGMDVMLYSDNISLEDELALKRLAARKNLLVMGPDCGTAIINGTALAFANRVQTGDIGLVAASGTGLQEVTCLLDRFGAGVSHAFGTGGRDLKDEIGGLTTFAALDRLLKDPDTRQIGIVGKPPGAATRAALAQKISDSGKPVAVHYLGTEHYGVEDAAGIAHASNLTDFARLLAKRSGIAVPSESPEPPLPETSGGCLRGLFSGGTLCQEAAELAVPLLGEVASNLSLRGARSLGASEPSRGHAFWDFGADEFTVGRPHPMMAPELRMQRLVRELCDPEVGVVLLDVVIGYGAAGGQAELVVEALREAERKSNGASACKTVVASVCGTEKDVPSRSAQCAVLRAGGVTVLESNAQAAVWAARVAQTRQPHKVGGAI